MKFHKTCGGYCVILRDCEGVCFDMGQYIYIFKNSNNLFENYRLIRKNIKTSRLLLHAHDQSKYLLLEQLEETLYIFPNF
jgi:hypothetical protein